MPFDAMFGFTLESIKESIAIVTAQFEAHASAI